MSSPTVSKRLLGLVEPAILLANAVLAFFQVAKERIIAGNGSVLFKPSTIRDEAFSRFWLKLSDPSQIPEDPSDLVGSAALVPPLLASVTGTVLEIGPGSGTQIRYFNKGSDITRICAAEPAVGLHAQLRERADEAGLGNRYTILPCPAQPELLLRALQKEQIVMPGEKPDDGAGLFDCIVCVRVLCSVPQPEKVAQNLHRLLKPGGTLFVVEHVKNPWRSSKGSLIARAVQTVYELLGWSFFVGDCRLTRDTEYMLGQAGAADGGWKSIEIDRNFGWTALPYISGRYVKKP